MDRWPPTPSRTSCSSTVGSTAGASSHHRACVSRAPPRRRVPRSRSSRHDGSAGRAAHRRARLRLSGRDARAGGGRPRDPRRRAHGAHRPERRRQVDAGLAREVGIAFQNPDRQIFAGRVAAEVEFGPRNLGISGADLDERVNRALADVGLADDRDTNPYDLGYSQRKLLALASILAMRTPTIVLDEPTTGQDASGVLRIRGIVERLAAEGRTVVAISHDMRFVAETFERIVVMREGTIILDGDPGTVFGESSWEALASTGLDLPLAARIGARAGLGSTPSETSLV